VTRARFRRPRTEHDQVYHGLVAPRAGAAATIELLLDILQD